MFIKFALKKLDIRDAKLLNKIQLSESFITYLHLCLHLRRIQDLPIRLFSVWRAKNLRIFDVVFLFCPGELIFFRTKKKTYVNLWLAGKQPKKNANPLLRRPRICVKKRQCNKPTNTHFCICYE